VNLHTHSLFSIKRNPSFINFIICSFRFKIKDSLKTIFILIHFSQGWTKSPFQVFRLPQALSGKNILSKKKFIMKTTYLLLLLHTYVPIYITRSKSYQQIRVFPADIRLWTCDTPLSDCDRLQN
jgi:hypothetical protein